MADPLMPPVVIAGVGYIEVAHERGQVAERRFDEEVKMVGHENVAA